MNVSKMNSFNLIQLLLSLNLLQYLLLANGQSTPQDKCDALDDGATSYICNSCSESVLCTGGPAGGTLDTAINICDDTIQICDSAVLEGACIAFPNPVSPICSCTEDGCFADPNNPELFYNCATVDTIGTAVDPTGCAAADPTTPIFDQPTCACAAVADVTCPTCGQIPVFESECTMSYVICSGASASDTVLECPDGTCFNSTLCSCQSEGGSQANACSDTAVCDKYPDSTDATGKEYCICLNDPDDLTDDFCGIPCSDSEIFDADTCGCVQDPGSTTPAPCPPCQKIPDANNEFGYCVCDQSGNDPICLPCDSGTKFNTATCECEEDPTAPIECPACQKKTDPSNSPSGYCVCQEGAADICFECPAEEIFDSDICDCAESTSNGSQQSTPDSNDSTIPDQTTPDQTTPEQTTPEQTTPDQTTPEQTTPEQTTPDQTTPEQTTPDQTTPEQTTPKKTTPEPTSECQPCGLADDPNDDCSRYYACDTATGDLTTGPYICPGNLCFNPEGCNCV